MGAYSQDLRERILRAREEGATSAEVAQHYKVHKRTVERSWKRYQETGERFARKAGGCRRSRLEGHGETLRKWIKQEAGLTLAELQLRCSAELGIKIGINALWHRLEKLGLSFKKSHARRRARAARRKTGS